MTNTNCLSGFRCPNCGSCEPFRVECTTMLTVFDSGGDDVENFEWDDASYCECCACGQTGTVKDFTGPAAP